MKLGDGNNAYFHAIVKEKNKQLGFLEDKHGNFLGDFKEIEKEILQFYQDLIGTKTQSMLHVDIEVLGKGNQLQELRKDQLFQQVTKHDIWSALNNIGEAKAPSMDGFTSKFFKETWSITKKDFIVAVLEFFDDNYMSDAVNCDIVTLIPKSSEAKALRDMRHIPYC